MSDEKMRAEFEAWVSSQGFGSTWQKERNVYSDFTTNFAWQAWKARAAMQGEAVGWVNSDELDNMLDDRTATLFPVRTGFHGKPLYAAPQPVDTAGFTLGPVSNGGMDPRDRQPDPTDAQILAITTAYEQEGDWE